MPIAAREATKPAAPKRSSLSSDVRTRDFYFSVETGNIAPKYAVQAAITKPRNHSFVHLVCNRAEGGPSVDGKGGLEGGQLPGVRFAIAESLIHARPYRGNWRVWCLSALDNS